MKKIITICAAILITACVFLPKQGHAQSPEKMSYQAVVRDGSNALVSSSAIGMRIQILQGSEFGAAVYVETHTPTSNANGLVSIEIGSGTVVNGVFANIDWSNGPYFIKTETDPTGGTSYTITGTSQLLSVPFALHAKTAKTLKGGITETDPVFGTSIASGITGADTSNWNNKLDSFTENDPVFGASIASGITGADTTNWNSKQDLLTAGTGVKITNNVISNTTYSVGDFAHGGIVFWVDATGQHGLVCAKTNQSSGVRWSAGTFTSTMALGDGPKSGFMNTVLILASQGKGDANTYAARICSELQITEGGKTYGDWYLPSKAELQLMINNRNIINSTATANNGTAFTSGRYWSSTESNYSSWYAWYVTSVGASGEDYMKSNQFNVRAVRAF